MTTPGWKWISVEPGKLVLDGTPFRIEYDGIAQEKHFVVMHNDNAIRHEARLIWAKKAAELRASELLEMGLIELEAQP